MLSRIHRDFDYEPGATHVTTTIEEVLDRRAGVCQDFAHLAVGCLRSLGLAARYVSGFSSKRLRSSDCGRQAYQEFPAADRSSRVRLSDITQQVNPDRGPTRRVIDDEFIDDARGIARVMVEPAWIWFDHFLTRLVLPVGRPRCRDAAMPRQCDQRGCVAPRRRVVRSCER